MINEEQGAWGRPGRNCVDDAADGLHHVEVLLFAIAADVVGFAGPAGFEHAPQCAAMVLDKEPVADVLPVAVDRQRLSLQAR